MARELQMFCLGVNYRNCPVAVREQFSVGKSRLAEVNAALAALPGVEECVLLSTCNRTELYFWCSDEADVLPSIMQYFLGEAPDAAALRAFFYLHHGTEALFHLAAVAAGLDSMVVGETEIFGQLKDAYRVALECGVTGGFANRTFQSVFTIGKKVRSSSNITSGPTSVGAAAVQMAQGILGNLEGTNVLVVGAGEVARTTAQSLRSRGAESIFVANRSYDRAVELANQVGGRVIRFAEWVPYLENIDIVIVSTASPVYVVSPPVLEQVQKTRGRSLFLIDLSVPRNVDPACGLVDDVYVYDMDAMEKMTEETRRLRAGEIAACEQMIRAWVQENADSLLKKRVFCGACV
ncbi:MAG: glutamyl-tRNA reductase [Akkermansiaceae bacterium]|nr:glutamyl-tRNA reductase [Akkermansiaceae bacterium]